MTDALAERQSGPGADQQRQLFQRRVEGDPLAAGEPLVAVEIIPAGLIIRQPHLTLTGARLDHAGHQQVAPQQEVIAFGEGLRVVLMIEEGRAQHRLVVSMRLPQQGIQIGQQAVAQLNRGTNGRGNGRIHPGFVDRLVVIP